ncbi:cysteine desulfurase [Vulcanimicrobium alpinum]|uniref:cysteine desulfurase n=1 Tax=Vulcanimicrobium alpinum TaxID=3016050 RepID=A0AAN2CBK6_UNVUL|nr:aminotransferase class V-fold PLP-dependent enzyme [Vulcanimicrobium alpinum]BDE08143.1 cysteine desulfurase [Vulcanimicrobium alpinum]
MDRVFLDHAATTPMRPEAVEAMLPLLGGSSNPSSLHAEGRAARAALDAAREAVAAVVGAAPREIVFTGGGSESDTLAILGAARATRSRGRHAITAAVEHHAVLHAVDLLEEDGWNVTRLPVDSGGRVDPAAVAAALTPQTALVSIALANNELGTVQPVAEIARLAHAAGALVHTDAVQAPGWLALDVDALGVDLLSLSAHKFSGPKGAGVLYVRRGTPVAPLIVGGGQEHGLRAGTENVAAIAALAAALVLAEAERAVQAPRVASLRDRLETAILASIPGSVVNAASAPRLPTIASLAFAETPGDALLIRLDLEGIAASAGSACAAGSAEPSHVIAAIGLDARFRAGVVRFSLGRETTSTEIDEVIRRLPAIVADVRIPVSV